MPLVVRATTGRGRRAASSATRCSRSLRSSGSPPVSRTRGDAETLDADPGQPDHLGVVEHLLVRHPVEALGGHAVGAAQVAPVGERDPQVGGHPAVPVAERSRAGSGRGSRLVAGSHARHRQVGGHHGPSLGPAAGSGGAAAGTPDPGRVRPRPGTEVPEVPGRGPGRPGRTGTSGPSQRVLCPLHPPAGPRQDEVISFCSGGRNRVPPPRRAMSPTTTRRGSTSRVGAVSQVDDAGGQGTRPVRALLR